MRKIVFGLGNTLNRDEGLGVAALLELQSRLERNQVENPGFRVDAELLDGGVLGLNLLPWVEEASHLLILDAVDAGRSPGTMIELKKEEIPLYRGVKMSDHQITFQEVLGLAKFRGHLPERIHLIGAQPEDISTGVEISPGIQAVIPKIVDRALDILLEWDLIDNYGDAK